MQTGASVHRNGFFKNYFSVETYDHFLHLSLAYRILNSTFNERELQLADGLLKLFVGNYYKFYGAEQLVYNVHSLLHLADDCKLYGPVPSFSAYKFENEMGEIRGMVRSKNRRFEQLFNRCSDIWEGLRVSSFKCSHNTML